jgi:very-short-patch-repair endonuclease
VLQAAGYRVVRITWRRLAEKPADVARLIRRLLGP